MNLLGSKKAIVGDVIASVVFLLVFGFVTIISYLILTEFCDGMFDAGFTEADITDNCDKFLNVLRLFDLIMVVLLSAMIIGVGVISRRIASAPVFFIIVILASGVLGYISYFFNYLFIQLVSDPLFDTVVILFPRIMLINTNLHWVALAVMVIGSITLYGKREKGQFVA